MQCLILAAGKGSRLSGKGQPKPLVSFLGLPLVERTILTAKSCGIQEFCVVTGFEGEKVRSFLSTLQDKHKVSIVSIVNEEWEKENGISVLKA
ncbi:MAG TPA: nucleotidyltransferase, partial [Desulfobacterales bacterium]|nr:nucleotidyltransferase [Desulfobacterales bacterium]